MSGIFGVFMRDRGPVEERLVGTLLEGLQHRGHDLRSVRRLDGAALGVSRKRWEGAHRDGVLAVGGLAIAADASLYYRDDLRTGLRRAGIEPETDTPEALILAAYRAWGRECVRHLEGDYAFILWDGGDVFCGRDFAGARPLFYLTTPSRLLIASTVAALRGAAEPSLEFNGAFLAETAANLWLPADETAYLAIQALPAGSVLATRPRNAVRTFRAWTPPPVDRSRAPSFADAAVALRERLARAVEERVADAPTASVWMSGGRDSTAVFGVNQQRVQLEAGRRLQPISVSYPVGHRGREDEIISAVAKFWNVSVHWLRIADIPFFAAAGSAARRRDEPYAPPYEMMNRALARATRRVGAHVALDGWGGDQLFELSPAYLADLFRGGRWLALLAEWRRLRIPSRSFLFQWAVMPVIPTPLRQWLRVRGNLERRIPDWIMPGWASQLRERQRSYLPHRDGASFADHELYVSLTSDTAARVRGWLSAIALDEDVEVRSPLYDGRVIEIAVQRPASERRCGRDTKLLLRAALRGLLPDEVLAPRHNRTGLIGDYFRAGVEESLPRLLREILAAPLLADLGLINPRALARAADHCLLRSWNDETAAALFFTVQTELWLRAVDRTVTHDDGQRLAVLPPGKRPGTVPQREVSRV